MTLNRERDMKQTDQGIDWSTVVSRALLSSLLWWALTDGTAGSWWIGAPAVAGAVIISVTLVPPLGLVWRQDAAAPALKFIDFLSTERAQKIMISSGTFPVSQKK